MLVRRTPRARRALLVTSAALLVALAAAGGRASTEEDQAVIARFAGTYESPLEDGGAAVIRAAVEAGIDGMPAVRRSVAERRLLASSPPIPKLVVAAHDEGVRIHYVGSARDNRSPRLGVFTTMAAAGGGKVDVEHRVVGGRLRETYREARGGSVHTFSRSSGGRKITLKAEISSRFLPRKIRYRLDFDRAR